MSYIPNMNSKQFEAIAYFGNTPFKSMDIRRWAAIKNGRLNVSNSDIRGYWSVNLTDHKYGLLTRFAEKQSNGTYVFRKEVVQAVKTSIMN